MSGSENSSNVVSAPISGAAPTQPTETTPQTDGQEKPVRQSMGTKRDELRAKLNAGANKVFEKAPSSSTPEEKAEEPSTQPETAPAGAQAAQEVSDKAGDTAEKLEEAGAKVPEKKPTERKEAYEHRLAQLLLKVQRAEADGLKHKTFNEQLSAKVKEYEAKFERATKDAVFALSLAGKTPDELAQDMLDGKLTKSEEKAVKAELPAEVQELLEEAKRLKAEKAAAQERAEAEELRKKNVAIVEQARTASVSEYPILNVLTPDIILNVIEAQYERTGVEPAFGEIAEILQQNYLSDLKHVLSNDSVLDFFLKSAPEVKEKMAKALGLGAPAQTAPVTSTPSGEKPAAEGAKTLTNASGAAPVKTSAKMSEKERRQRAAAAAGSIFDAAKRG